jgi:hypothetical protein
VNYAGEADGRSRSRVAVFDSTLRLMRAMRELRVTRGGCWTESKVRTTERWGLVDSSVPQTPDVRLPRGIATQR